MLCKSLSASEIKEIISDSKIDPSKDIADEINIILKDYIVSLMRPLENNDFLSKAPEVVVEEQRTRQSDYEEKRSKLRIALERLKA